MYISFNITVKEMTKQLLLQFYISHFNLNEQPFLFWSCVLDTSFDNLKNSDYKRLESSIDHKLLPIKNFKVYVKITEWLNYNTDDLIRRNSVFLPIEKNYSKCSPYTNSCTLLDNYYDENFDNKFNNYIQLVSEKTNCNYTDLFKVKIQKAAIKAIKDLIGLDILSQESVPGSIAVYKQLPKFELITNYNAELGERYISCNFTEEEEAEYLIELEIPEGRKILYKQLFNLKPNKKIILPSLDKLEQFGQIHITIYIKTAKNTCVIYEETGHLIRAFSFGINVGGGSYKLIQNRFTNNANEKIALTTYTKTNCDGRKFDPFYYELAYKETIDCIGNEFLNSYFFPSDQNGRKDFLEWARNVLQQAKEVTIIDPFFDFDGLKDFNSCATTYFSLNILTTDPEKCLREKNGETVEIDSHLIEEITNCFPQSKVYFLQRDKLHDRFLIIFDGDNTTYYSMSNSWNGTANNYSLFVQELNHITSLHIKEEYSKYLNDNYLKTINNKEILKEKEKKHNFETNINKDYSLAKDINSTFNNEDFKVLFSDLFLAEYYGSEIVEKNKLLKLCSSKFTFLQDTELFIKDLIIEILTSQRNEFILENQIINADRSLGDYISVEDCYKDIANRLYYTPLPYYHLKIEYSLFQILEVCFYTNPEIVLNELVRQEKEICKINYINNEKKEYYFVSKQIIMSLLSENYKFFPKQAFVELINFANLTNNVFCKTYIFQWILDSDEIDNFDGRLEELKEIQLTDKDLCFLLGKSFAEFVRINNDLSKIRRKNIELFINRNFRHNEDCLLMFALHAYIFVYEIQINNLREFILQNKNIGAKLNELFLLYSLNDVPDRSLYNLIFQNVDKHLYSFLPSSKQNANITDVGKFINCIPYLGIELSEILLKHTELIDGIVYKFKIYPDYIFEINRIPENEFDCYSLLIILVALFEIKNNSNDLSNKIIDKELSKIKWYMSFLINKHHDDFYGLSFRILDIYSSFISDNEKKDLEEKLNYEELKLFLLSEKGKLNDEDCKRFEALLNNYEFKNYDKSKSIIYLLALFANLVVYSEMNDNVSDLLSKINKLFNNSIKSSKIEEFIVSGINYFAKRNDKTRKDFIDEMKYLYYPYSVQQFIEAYQ